MSKAIEARAHHAFRILQVAFIILALIAGLDKFFNLLTEWTQYLSPFTLQMIDYKCQGFMMFVGILEIIAAIGVLFRPRIFANVIAVWLFLIICNLLIGGRFFDIVLRDFGLMLSALALGALSPHHRGK